MSILGSIFSKIFPSSHAAPSSAPAPAAAAPAPASSPAPAPAPMQQVDVEGVLDGMARGSGQTLNWRTSIVDLMKLLGLDSSLRSEEHTSELQSL